MDDHRWTKAGLGQAPFKYLGMTEKLFQACLGAPIKAGGCCNYCFTGIRYCFTFRSSDGKEFVVGSSCMTKSGDHGIIKTAKKEVSKLAKKKRAEKKEKDQARIEATLARVGEVSKELKALDHPSIKNGTMLDYVVWMSDYAGHTGRLKITRIVEDLLKRK